MSGLLSKELREQRRALLAWGGGFAAMVLIYSSFWPSVRGNADQFQSYIEHLPDALRNIIGELSLGTPVGYLQSELFSLLGPALILVFAIGAGARSIAGEEEQDTLDLLAVTPIRRRRIVIEKFVSMSIIAFGLGGSLWAALESIGRAFGLTIPAADAGAATLHLVLLGIAFGGIATLVGCWSGRRSLAVGVAASLAVATFLLDAFAPSVSGLAWAAKLTPFYYYGEGLPLQNGLQLGHAAVLAAISALALLGSVLAFERRDLAT